ncbi:DNA adenine methylase [Myceligenerans crystallogenes]|uniref:site-specific DNA-methyltransferase (adenine-specific) n=1 Tax=Myceligenerans crystallogenes TaxID=316335 RepID=A0ABN2NC31_9MICO
MTHIATAPSTVKILASRRYGTLSPLRYPGGKAALAGLFADVISSLNLTSATYVEPYAGGAGAGIALLRQGLVDRLVINDFDVAVHAFWRSILEQTEEFVELVRTVPLTIDEWQVQRAKYRAADTSDPLSLGFAFFYLNRTNRSGVLRGGVIGGQAQTGNYKIDARFNRTTLAERITEIGKLAEHITVNDRDGRTIIKQYAKNPSAFMYIDPPYVRAGSRLYLNAFDARDHAELAKVVCDVEQAHWLMTYDIAPMIEELYVNNFQCRYELNYSARHPGLTDELMIASEGVARFLKARMQDQQPA